MGALPIEVHWQRLVVKSIRDYISLEAGLFDLYNGSNPHAVEEASYETLRCGMIAAIFLHHFSEVAYERGALASFGLNSRKSVIATIAAWPRAEDGTIRPADSKILGEVADAIKHAELTAHHIIHVPRKARVIEISHENPLFHEGYQDGRPQVVVSTTSGARSLRGILENVCRGWTDQLSLAPLT